METKLYKNIEKNFDNNAYYFIKNIPLFLKDNYLFLCIFCAFLWLFYAFYPGTVAYDSFVMYADAYNNHTGNWHSALLTRFWRIIQSVTDIKGIYVFIPLAATCLGLYITAKHISKGILTGIICILILFLPPIFTYITTVLKDTYVASLVFLIAALMMDRAISDKKKTTLFCVFSTVILVFCFFVRSNGCFIAVPLLIAIFMGWKARIIYRYIACLILVICVIVATPFIDLKLLHADDEAPDFSLLIFDIAGTAKYSGVSTLPDIPGVPDQVSLFKNCYSNTQWDSVSSWATANCNSVAAYFYHERDSGKKRLKAARQELRKAWIAAITQHPVAYLKHRLSFFNRFIDYQGHQPVFQPFYIEKVGFIDMVDRDQNRALTYTINPPDLWNTVIHMDLAKQLWFHPYVSLLILLFFYLATLGTSDRFNRTLNVVAFSGLIYLVGYLFVGVSSEFRYSYPSLLLSILCILAAFGYYSQKHEVFGTKKTRIIAASVTIPLFLVGIVL